MFPPEKKPARVVFFFFFVLLFLLGGAFCLRKKFSREKRLFFPFSSSQLKIIISPAKKEAARVLVEVDFGQGKKISGQVKAENPYEALEKLAQEKNFALQSQKYDFGLLVKAIEDQVNTKEAGWFYFVNGKGGEISAEKYIIKEGDRVVWRYQKF